MVAEPGSIKIDEAIIERRSIRSFKPDPVPRDVLSNIIEIAVRAPSWENFQPWEFVIVCGSTLREINNACIEHVRTSGYDPDFKFPSRVPEPYHGRGKSVGKALFKTMGIQREDKQRRNEHLFNGLRMFDAPAAIYVCIDSDLFWQDGDCNVYPVYDCGFVSQNITLLAMQHGLGTVIQAQGVICPAVVREKLGLPDSKLMVASIAIGYPDETAPANSFRSERVPIDDVAKWYGW